MIIGKSLNMSSFLLIFYCFFLLTIFFDSDAIGETEISKPAQLQIRISNGLVTGEVYDQPLIEVITKLAELAGFKVIVFDDTVQYPTVSTSFDKLSTQHATQQLLDDVNSVIFFKPNHKKNNKLDVAQVWLVGLQANSDNANYQQADQTTSDHSDYAEIKSLNDAVVELLHDENALSKKERDHILTGLIKVVQSAEDPIIKARAAISLGNFRDTRAITILETLLVDIDPMVRSQAIYALEQIGGTQAIVALGNLLLNRSANLTERTKAARILKNMNTVNAKHYLDSIEKYTNDPIGSALNQEPTSKHENKTLEQKGLQMTETSQ